MESMIDFLRFWLFEREDFIALSIVDVQGDVLEIIEIDASGGAAGGGWVCTAARNAGDDAGGGIDAANRRNLPLTATISRGSPFVCVPARATATTADLRSICMTLIRATESDQWAR